jgi:hypothetical protein
LISFHPELTHFYVVFYIHIILVYIFINVVYVFRVFYFSPPFRSYCCCCPPMLLECSYVCCFSGLFCALPSPADNSALGRGHLWVGGVGKGCYVYNEGYESQYCVSTTYEFDDLLTQSGHESWYKSRRTNRAFYRGLFTLQAHQKPWR